MPVLRPVRSAPPAAARLAAILRRIGGGGLAGLPVDVELWDGSVLPAGAPGGSAGRLRVGRRALAYLLDVLRRSDEPVCQCEFIALFDIGQSLLSHHVRKLVAAGLVEVERRHRWAYYSASPDALKELTAWLS